MNILPISDLEMLICSYLIDTKFICEHSKDCIEFYKAIHRSSQTIDWNYISQKITIRESFIREFAKYMNWEYLCRYRKLSECFMRDFADKLDWQLISKWQVLSESFMSDFIDKLNWTLSKYQLMSESFIHKFSNKINWTTLPRRRELSEELLEII